MILVNEDYLVDLVHEAVRWGKISNFSRESVDECFKGYLDNLTYELDALHLSRKQKAKLKKAIERHLEFMKAMEKLDKGIIEREGEWPCE